MYPTCSNASRTSVGKRGINDESEQARICRMILAGGAMVRSAETLKRPAEGTRCGPVMPERKRASHMPPEFTAVTPYLTVDDPDRLVAFVKEAFRAEELEDQRAVGSDGKVLHAALRVDGGIVEIGRAAAQWRALPSGIHLYVRNVDATYKRALKAGGVSLHDVRDMEYGERAAAVRDPSGNHWYIATYTGQMRKKSG